MVRFSDVKSIALIILELVDYVYRLAVRMFIKFYAGPGEQFGGMVNGTSLAPGSVARSEASGAEKTEGLEICVNNKLAEVGRISESDRGSFGEEALG